MSTTSFLLSVVTIVNLSMVVSYISKVGIYNPTAIVLVSALPYFFSHELDYFILSSEQHNLLPLIHSQLILSVFFFAFRVSCSFFHKKMWVGGQYPEVLFLSKYRLVLVISMFTIVFFLFFMAENLYQLSKGNRAEFYRIKPLVYDLFRYFVYTAMLFVALEVSKHKNKVPMLLTIGLVMFYLDVLLVGDRRLWLTAVIGSIVVIRPKGNAKYYLIFLSLALIVFLAVVGLSRSGGSASGWSSLFYVLNPVNMEFGYYNKIAKFCYANNCEILNNTYFDLPLQLIPSAIIGERPSPPSYILATLIDADYASKGGTFAYNFLMEASRNLMGIPVVMFGVFFGYTSWYFSTHSNNTSRILAGLYVYCLLFFPRMELLSILKLLSVYLLFMVFIGILYFKVRYRRLV